MRVIVLSLALLLVALPARAGEGTCYSDSDCGGGKCRSGKCTTAKN